MGKKVLEWSVGSKSVVSIIIKTNNPIIPVHSFIATEMIGCFTF